MIDHEWLLGLSGVLDVAFGVLLFFRPVAGAVALAIWIGAYAFIAGVMLFAVGFRLRSYLSHRDELRGHPARA